MLVPLRERECHCLLCEPPGHRLSRRDAHHVELVTGYGWVILGVTATSGPDWVYTIGLWHTFGSPEVCLLGKDQRRATEYVNTVAEQIRDGRPLAPREVRTGVMGGWNDTLAPAPVHDTWYPRLFGAAIDYYQRPPFPVLQLVWPDGAGRFPWEPEVHEGLGDLQPALWLPAPGPDLPAGSPDGAG